MTAAANQFGLASWDDLADPRENDAPHGGTTSICVTKKRWQHIVKEHVADRGEPWDAWLTHDLKKKLIAFASGGNQLSKESRSALRQASKLLEREVIESTSIPLVLLYQRRRRNDPQRAQVAVWELLLPSGIVAVVHETNEGNLLWTAYFPNPATKGTNSLDRWREAVRYQIDKYTDRRRPPGSWKHIDYVATSRPVPKRDRPGETCHQVRWVTLASWGFQKDRRFGMRWSGIANVSVPPSSTEPDKVADTTKFKLDPLPASQTVDAEKEVSHECRSGN